MLELGETYNMPVNKLDQFDAQVQGLVNADRMRDYGHPADHFEASAAIKGILREHFGSAQVEPDERLLHVLDMIADKMVRLCNSPDHLDSWIDIAGYARTAVMVLDHDAASTAGPQIGRTSRVGEYNLKADALAMSTKGEYDR